MVEQAKDPPHNKLEINNCEHQIPIDFVEIGWNLKKMVG